MKTENRDFFYYDPDFSAENADFTDEKVFSPEERKDFLCHYADFLKSYFNLPNEPKKVVPETDAINGERLFKKPISNPKSISNKTKITEPLAVTLSAGREKASVLFSCKTDRDCKINLYLSEIWPEKNAEKLIGTYDSDGIISAKIDFKKINLWSPEDPVLYSVRFEALSDCGEVDNIVIETGFRTIEQKNGSVYLNGQKITLKGALAIKDFSSHCKTETPQESTSDRQIVWQYMMLKRLCGNSLKLSINEYLKDGERYADFADRIGVFLVIPIDNNKKDLKNGVHPSIFLLDEQSEQKNEEFFRLYSNECKDEELFGFRPAKDSPEISQACEALIISNFVKKYRIADAGGMLCCSLMDGENEGAYLYPPIDNCGYAKLGFFTMREHFKTVTCFNDTDKVKRGKAFTVSPVLFANTGDTRNVTASIIDESGAELDSKVYNDVECFGCITRLADWKPILQKAGYYAVKFIVK